MSYLPASMYPMPSKQNAPRNMRSDTGSRPFDSLCGWKKFVLDTKKIFLLGTKNILLIDTNTKMIITLSTIEPVCLGRG